VSHPAGRAAENNADRDDDEGGATPTQTENTEEPREEREKSGEEQKTGAPADTGTHSTDAEGRGEPHRRTPRRRIAVVEPPSPFDEVLVGGDLRLPARIFTYLAVGALAAYPLIALGRGYDAELGALILTITAALAAAPRRAQPIEAKLLYAAKYYLNTARQQWRGKRRSRGREGKRREEKGRRIPHKPHTAQRDLLHHATTHRPPTPTFKCVGH
jgi:hypothetical protein